MRQVNALISISGDGTRTVAEAVLSIAYDAWSPPASDMITRAVAYDAWSPAGEMITGTGSAGRERGDKNDQSVGDDLAVARALRSMAAHLEKRANGKVRHAESIKAHRCEIAVKNAFLAAPDTGFDVKDAMRQAGIDLPESPDVPPMYGA